ncbi:MAG TPA: VWA domain-containing protein [Candidatus Binataceae bacterium]|nr:VWA domain-containing protein [Candidatus Binataceae bacterium]
MGLLEPINLLYAASLAALVLIYLRARSRPTIEVASLILFEEVPAPVAKSRFLRLDVPFWLEALALAALTLAVAGLYVKTMHQQGHFRRHALVFDLGAGMGATVDGRTRLDQARQSAVRLVDDAAAGDEFSVISYALEAKTPLPMTNRKADVRAAIAALRVVDVAPRPAAARAALIRARNANSIDLYSDRPLAQNIIADAALPVAVEFHKTGEAAANLAIVGLDPGMPKAAQGRCLIRNFSIHPEPFELEIDAGGRKVFHSALIAEPGGEVVVPFGPLTAGGLVRARIVTSDALAADNERFAIAPSIATEHALVLSPELSVRDDLARLLLAVNPNFIVSAGDPNQKGTFDATQKYALAILHDCSGDGIDAASRMYIFPEPPFPGVHDNGPAQVVSSVALAEMEQTTSAGPLSAPVLLGPSRVIKLPGWMTATARGAGAVQHALIPLAAIGRQEDGVVGVIAFDVRNHLLLDPDRMEALVLTVDMLRRMVAPVHLQVASTGSYVDVAAAPRPARLIAPDGTVQTIMPDQWGQVHFRPMMAGRYRLIEGDTETQVLANYYDASESDLESAAVAVTKPPPRPAVMQRGRLEVQPFTIPLIVLALIALIGESLLLARRAQHWGMNSV